MTPMAIPAFAPPVRPSELALETDEAVGEDWAEETPFVTPALLRSVLEDVEEVAVEKVVKAVWVFLLSAVVWVGASLVVVISVSVGFALVLTSSVVVILEVLSVVFGFDSSVVFGFSSSVEVRVCLTAPPTPTVAG
jgi:hypothetical protein